MFAFCLFLRIIHSSNIQVWLQAGTLDIPPPARPCHGAVLRVNLGASFVCAFRWSSLERGSPGRMIIPRHDRFGSGILAEFLGQGGESGLNVSYSKSLECLR